jgi:hypothetical protein
VAEDRGLGVPYRQVGCVALQAFRSPGEVLESVPVNSGVGRLGLCMRGGPKRGQGDGEVWTEETGREPVGVMKGFLG